jgi:hypothetical protein
MSCAMVRMSTPAIASREANPLFLFRREETDALIVLRLAADARGRIGGDFLVIESVSAFLGRAVLKPASKN